MFSRASTQSALGHGRVPATRPRGDPARDISAACNAAFASPPISAGLERTLSTESNASTSSTSSTISIASFDGTYHAHKSRVAPMAKCHNPPLLSKNDHGLYPRPNIPYTGFGAAKSETMRLASGEINACFHGIVAPAPLGFEHCPSPWLLRHDYADPRDQRRVDDQRAAAAEAAALGARMSFGSLLTNQLRMRQRR